MKDEIVDPGRYDQIARVFHWLTAAVILFAFIAGVSMTRMASGPEQDRMFVTHRSFGTLVLGLVVIRLAWRLIHPAPPLPATIGGMQRFAADVMHWLIYGLMLAQPLLGWLGSNAFGAPVHIFGLFDLPVLTGKDDALATILFGAHQFVAYTLLALVTLHITAAMYHMARQDSVMDRMWW